MQGRRALSFTEIDRIGEGNSETRVYEGSVAGSCFGYLYANRLDYSLVWDAPTGFAFDKLLPYAFVEHQFSFLPPSRILAKDLVMPPARPNPATVLKYPHFLDYQASRALLVLKGDENSTEYDLVSSDRDRDKYLRLVDEGIATIIFARYDSVVAKQQRELDCCITFEAPQNETNANWELTVKLPRHIRLSERAFIWILKHHDTEIVRQHLDVRASLNALVDVVDNRPAPVFGELS